MKGVLKLERTSKFATFCVPANLPPPSENSPNGHGSTAFSARLSKAYGREPSRKLDYLRNSLKKLSTMDVYAQVPPSPASSLHSPRNSNSSGFARHLLRMDSSGEIRTCDMCTRHSQHGLSCSAGHFTCSTCFGSRVRDLCGQPGILKSNDFSIFCPVPRCPAQPWSSYHVRKLLDGPTLQLYIDVLVDSCRGGSNNNGGVSSSSNAMPPMLSAISRGVSSTRNSRKSVRIRSFTEPAIDVAPPPTQPVPQIAEPSTVIGVGAATTHATKPSAETAVVPIESMPSEPNEDSEEWKCLLETTEMLREQLRKLNIVPMEYIPLPEIQAELATIFEKINSEQPYDEQRMDFLLMCMENNPVYMAEKAEIARLWREEMSTYTQECLQTMRGFVPGHIFESSLQSLTQTDGLTMDLAKRLLSKKCLWLVRMCVVDIERIHEVDLMGRFNPIAQNLDIVELAAIFASVPEKFLNDPTGRKTQWRLNLENALREMDKQRKTGSLVGAKARNPCYKKQTVAPFAQRNTMKRVEFVQSSLT